MELCLVGYEPPRGLTEPPALLLRGFWTGVDGDHNNQGFWNLSNLSRLTVYQAQYDGTGIIKAGTPWEIMGLDGSWRSWAKAAGIPKFFETRAQTVDALSMALMDDTHTAAWGLSPLPAL